MGAPKLKQARSIADLMVVPDYARADELVRQGIDSSCLVVARRADEESALRQATLGVQSERGPLPLRPYDAGFRCLVVLPTYNESENLAAIVRDVLAYLATDVLVIDDASPDGTGAIADRLAESDARVRVLHRPSKQGLGTAYLRGFADAIAGGYERVLEMDSDFSHPPWDLPRLVAATRGAQLAIGSRYVAGGNTIGWSLRRRLLSRGANLYARTILGMSVRDATAGFRCYDVASLARLDLSRVKAEGYAFQIEMAFRMLRAGFSVAEIPIHFTDRRLGASKMDGRVAREAVLLVPALRFRVRREKKQRTRDA
jgi:dolichol-phosphate mannosyltransferase